MASTESNSSRFNPFKFNSKPPPLPPKDPVYLRSSPAPSTFVGDTTAPPSPISPTIQYAIRRANSPSPFSSAENNHIFATNMNYSTPSLLSPPPSSQPQQVQRQDSTSSKYTNGTNGNARHISTTSSKKDKALAFLKFPKRSPRSPPPQAGPSNLASSSSSVVVIGSDEGDDLPPPPQEDDNISMPWNFQHNIHVDDGYVGMPPSWSTSLASAGFTEEEIARIHTRREMGVRSPPDLRYLYNERPRSPASTVVFPPGPNQPPQPFIVPTTAPVPVLTHPTPRTTSLPRVPAPLVDQPLNTQQKPVLPSLQPTNPTLNANPAALSNPIKIASTPTAVTTPTSLVLGAGDPRRVPPPKPKRKPPSPYEPYEEKGTIRANQHRQNQPSSSTVGASTSDSHGYGSGYDASGSQNHDTTNDASYYNDPTFNLSSLSLQTRSTGIEDDDEDTPLALRPLRLGSESAASVASSSSSTGGARKRRRNNNNNNNGKFRVVNGDPRRRNSRSGSRNRSDSESLVSRSRVRRSMSRTRTGEEEEGGGVDLNSVDMGHHGRGGGGVSRSRSGERDRERDRDTITPGMSAAAMQMAMAGSTVTTTTATPVTTTTNPTTTAPLENEKKKGKSSIWGTKISSSSNKPTLNASASTSNLASTSISNNAFASTSSTTLPNASSSYAASGSSSGHNHYANATSSSFSSNANAQQGWKSTTTALASSVAAKSSSLAGGVVRQSSNLVEAVRVSAGRGVAKMKSGSLSKTTRKGKGGLGGLLGSSSQAEGEEEEEGGQGDAADSDEEFASLPQEDQQKRPAVWELYTRPTQVADAGGKEGVDSVSKQPTAPATTAIAPLRRQPSTGAKSVRSQGSQGSLRSRNMSSTSLGLGRSESGKGGLIYNLKASQSTGSLLSLTRKRGHTKNSGSVTSLDSIPEVASPPPLPTGPSSYNWTPAAPTQANAPSSADSGSAAASGSGPPRTKKTPALPPRLSLHQADSSDLSLWSEALISGISLSGDGGDLGLSFGLGEDKGKGKEKEREKGVTTAKPLTQAPTQTLVQAPAPSVQPQPQPQKKVVTSNRPTAALRKAGQPLPNSKPPPSRPIPPIVNANPAPTSTATGTATGGRSIDQKSGSGSGSAVLANGGSSKSGLGASSILGSNTNNDNISSPAPMTGIAEAATSARFMPVTPTPFSPAVFSSPMADKPLASLGNANDGTGVVSPVVVRKPATTVAQGNGLLSPPPSAWSTSADPAISPSGGSSAGPDSAQLWNEIEQMMDPTMMSAIPGLNLGVALPPGAQGVLRSAGVIVPSPLPLPPVGGGANVEGSGGGKDGVRTVGDLVGTSPVYSAVAKKGEERGRVGQQPQQIQEEDEGDDDADDDDDGSMYSGENPYDGYRTIQEINPSTLPTDIPPVPVIVRTPSPDSSLLGVSSSRELEEIDDHRDANPNRDSSRSSTSTLIATLHPISIVRTASVARRAGAYVVDNSSLEKFRERARVASNASVLSAMSVTSGAPSPATPAFVGNTLGSSTTTTSTSPTTTTAVPPPIDSAKYPPSPSLSAYFGGGGSSEESGSSSSMSYEQPTMTDTPTTDGGLASPLKYYLDGSQTPSPTPEKVVFGGGVQTMPYKRLPVRPEYDDELEEEEFIGYPDEDSVEAKAAIARAQAASSTPPAARPTIVISSDTVSPSLSGNAPGLSAASTPLSPFQRYRGWLSAVVAPLEDFIDEAVDPREHYLDLQEIAEGESGSVFAAVLNSSTAHKLRLPPLVKAKDADEILHGRTVLVAIKSVAIVPSGSPKLVDLQRELGLMRGLGLGHENVLGMDGVYVDLVEDSLWVRMELMERSLADIIGLAGDGLQLQERTIARFASDVLCALEYLQKHNIAHRDVRSDNLLLNKHGVLKLADFSNAIQVTRESSMRDDIVGVPFWQAPEVRRPPYDALKVDVWSLGATVWEMAQQDPPFADTQQLAERWPPLRQPDLFSPVFHDFLRKCSEPAAVRPSPGEMLKSSFITHKACGRQVVVLLLAQCMAIEKHLQEGNGVPSS